MENNDFYFFRKYAKKLIFYKFHINSLRVDIMEYDNEFYNEIQLKGIQYSKLSNKIELYCIYDIDDKEILQHSKVSLYFLASIQENSFQNIIKHIKTLDFLLTTKYLKDEPHRVRNYDYFTRYLLGKTDLTFIDKHFTDFQGKDFYFIALTTDIDEDYLANNQISTFRNKVKLQLWSIQFKKDNYVFAYTKGGLFVEYNKEKNIYIGDDYAQCISQVIETKNIDELIDYLRGRTVFFTDRLYELLWLKELNELDEHSFDIDLCLITTDIEQDPIILELNGFILKEHNNFAYVNYTYSENTIKHITLYDKALRALMTTGTFLNIEKYAQQIKRDYAKFTLIGKHYENLENALKSVAHTKLAKVLVLKIFINEDFEIQKVNFDLEPADLRIEKQVVL